MEAIIVFLDTYDKVDLYTIEKLDNSGVTLLDEFKTFRNRMDANGGRDKRQLLEMDAILNEILTKYGAVEEMFRREGDNNFRAIYPHEYKGRFWDSDGVTHFGLRLYCLRVNDEALIILGGCSKTKQDPLECPDCKDIFSFCKEFCKVFYEEIGKQIVVNDRYIIHVDAEDAEEDDERDYTILLNIKT